MSLPIHRRFWAGTRKKRFRLPFYARWAHRFIPQPQWLRRWYYRKSFDWWEHPSNHHWKGWIDSGFADGQSPRWIGLAPNLRPGERDIWSGEYCSGEAEARR